MPLEEEHSLEQEQSQNINETVDVSSNPQPNNNTPNDLPPPPSVNNNGTEVIVQTSSIQVGTEYYSPKSVEELDELVLQEEITPQQKKAFVFKYEAWHGELPLKTPLVEEEEEAPVKEETELDINSLIPELQEKPTDDVASPEISLKEVIPTQESDTDNPSQENAPVQNEKMPVPTENENPVEQNSTPIINIGNFLTEEGGEQGTEGDVVTAAPVKQLPTTESDPDFQTVETNVTTIGDKEQVHQTSDEEVQEAQKAALAPSNEKQSLAEVEQVGKMDGQEVKAFDGSRFKDLLMSRIARILPKTEDEAEDFKDNNEIDQIKTATAQQVSQEKVKATGPIENASKETPDVSKVQGKEVEELPENPIGRQPKTVHADKAVPKPFDQSEVEKPLQDNSKELDDQFASNDITDEQLEKSNEPQFLTALSHKNQAKEDSNTAPIKVRQDEQTKIEQNKQLAKGQEKEQMGGMHEDRASLLTQVFDQQKDTGEKDTSKRTEIANQINSIYQSTKSDVDGILSRLDQTVMRLFEAAAARAKNRFENYVDVKMRAYKDERYDGVSGAVSWVGDVFTGLPDEVNAFFMQGRTLYIEVMDSALTEIANIVAQELNAAKARIVQGKEEVTTYVESLPDDLQSIGRDAAKDINKKFDQLDSQVDSKQDELIGNLAQAYSKCVEDVDTRIEEMKAANRGLIDLALDAVGGVIEVITAIRNTLTNLVAAAIDAVGAIISDPIGFLSNLITGVGDGLGNFLGNITQHLTSGMVEWLTGTMSDVGIEMPEDVFSLSGIFSLVTQSLGLTYDYMREKAVKLMGERPVTIMEEGFEIFQVIQQDGLMGAWEYLKEQFGDLKETIMGAISEMLISQVVQAGIKWILGLLTPAGAFVKAAMMVIEVVEFFVTQGSKIIELVDAFVQSISAIAAGNVSQVAEFIEGALGRTIPILIDFLASLIGVDGIADKVQAIFGNIRERIDQTIDGLIEKAQAWFKDKKGRRKEKKENRDKDKAEKGKEDENENPQNENENEQEKDKRTDKQKQKDFDKAMKAGETILNDENRTNDDIKVDLNRLELKYRLEELRGKLLQETEEFHIWLLTAELGSHKGSKKIQREPTKAENEEQVSEEDRQWHEKIMDEVIAKLKSEGEEVEDEDMFEDFYADLKVKAKELGKEYQPKLRNGIKLTIDFLNSVGKDKEDGDVDMELEIAPNTKKEKVSITPNDKNKGDKYEKKSDNEIGKDVFFETDNESHKILINEKENSVEVEMTGIPVTEKIEEWRTKIEEWRKKVETNKKEKDTETKESEKLVKAESMLHLVKHSYQETRISAVEAKKIKAAERIDRRVNENDRILKKDKPKAKAESKETEFEKIDYQVEQSEIALKEAIKRLLEILNDKDKVDLGGKEIVGLTKEEKERVSKYYDIAILGAGSSAARWLYTHPKKYNNGIVIGETGGWDDRGQEYISHPKSIVSPKTPSVPDQSESGLNTKDEKGKTVTKFERAEDHLQEIKSIIDDSKYDRLEENVKSVQKRGDWSLVNHGGKGEAIAARKIVVATGAGPEREIAQEIENGEGTNGKHKYKKVVKLNEYLTEIEGLNPAKVKERQKEFGQRTVLIYGGNAAVDAINMSMKLGFEVIPCTRSEYEGHLPGTKNVLSKDKYEEEFSDKDKQGNYIVGNYKDHKISKTGEITVSFQKKKIKADQFVTAIGPESGQIATEKKNAGPIAILGGPGGVKKLLKPIYDLGKAYSDEEFATVLGLESEDGLLEVIGAAAFRSGQFAKDTEEAIERSNKLKLEQKGKEKKLDETLSDSDRDQLLKEVENIKEMLETFKSLKNKFNNAKKAHSKSVIVSEQLGTLNSTIEAINRVNAVMKDEKLKEVVDKQIFLDGINIQIDTWNSIQRYITLNWGNLSGNKKVEDGERDNLAEKSAKAVVSARKESSHDHGITWEEAMGIIKNIIK